MSHGARQNMDYLKKLETRLRSARALSPRVEAETLVAHFTNMKRLDLFTGTKAISPSERLSIEKALRTRRRGVPLAHVTGQAPFYGRDFQVTKDTLIPRPETEILVEETLKFLRARFAGKTVDALDIGTGSGCIALSLTLEYPACRMTALDASPKALAVASKNTESFGLDGRVRLVESRLFESFGPEKHGFWDVIVSNPPYVAEEDWEHLSPEVRSEPRLALDGGKGGLEIVKKILRKAPVFLKPGGRLFIEIGQGQSVRLAKFLKNNTDLKDLHFVKDLNWVDRVLVAEKHG